ncbi:MAG: DUF6209 family protein, partial [Solirubrobacteraceae bacterium]
ADITIPSDAEWIEMWFHNFLPVQVGGNQCDAWDSRYGQNYWYQVLANDPATAAHQASAAGEPVRSS